MRRPSSRSTAVAVVSTAAVLSLAAPSDAALRHQYTFNDGVAVAGNTTVPDVSGSAAAQDATFVDPTGLGRIASGMADLTNNNGLNSNQDWIGGMAEGIFIDLQNFTFTDSAFNGVTGEVSLECG